MATKTHDSIINTNNCTTLKKTSNGKVSPDTKRRRVSPKEELEQFDKVFPVLLQDCLNEENVKNDPKIGDAITHFLEVCSYNVPHGKKNRGVSVVTSFKCLIHDPSDEDLFKARVLGWCVEWLQGYFLVADDIMDHSLTRRGQPCWYKKDGVGMMAINDSFYLEAAIYKILKKYFRSEPYYVDILELFHETTLQTVIGQGLDLLTADDERVDFGKFNMSRFDTIVIWKTAYYSFYLPVALAMHMAGIKDEEAFNAAKDILLPMGHFFQVQDDFLDCFGDPSVTGKVGTDIEDNKCSWLINQALLRATQEQKTQLELHYARKDLNSALAESYRKRYTEEVVSGWLVERSCQHVKIVKQIYEDIGLRKLYSDYEESCYQELMSKISLLSVDIPKEMFIAFAEKIFKRNK